MNLHRKRVTLKTNFRSVNSVSAWWSWWIKLMQLWAKGTNHCKVQKNKTLAKAPGHEFMNFFSHLLKFAHYVQQKHPECQEGALLKRHHVCTVTAMLTVSVLVVFRSKELEREVVDLRERIRHLNDMVFCQQRKVKGMIEEVSRLCWSVCETTSQAFRS